MKTVGLMRKRLDLICREAGIPVNTGRSRSVSEWRDVANHIGGIDAYFVCTPDEKRIYGVLSARNLDEAKRKAARDYGGVSHIVRSGAELGIPARDRASRQSAAFAPCHGRGKQRKQ